MEVVALPSSGSEAGGFLVGDAELLRILNGVFEATNTPKDGIGVFKDWIACQSPLGASWNRPEGDGNAATTWLSCWKDMLRSTCFDDNPQLRLFVSLALVVAYLRLKHRQSSTPDARDIGDVWEVIHQVFTSDQFDPPLPNYFCRAHGYYVVPFCSLEAAPGTGDIELYRVHVWLPDDRRRDLDSSMYCCRCKTQSLVFVGEGVLKSVEGDSLAELATHNDFLDELLSDEGSRVSDRVCPSFQKKTLPLQAAQIQSHFHLLNTSYKVDGEVWHTLEVPPDTLRADLVVFRGGSTINPGGIEPVDAQVNRPESSTASLAFSANAVRSWQMLHEEGKYNARRSEMEEALRIFNKALSLCENFEGIPNSSQYANLVHAELGFVNRCLGRYEVAEYHLREALKEPQLSWCRLKSSGELGTVYRAMNRLHEAKVAFETQYEIAQQLDNQSTLCRAVGNLGMINYQLFLRESDAELLGVAVTQLKERVDRGRRIEEVLRKGNMEVKEKAARLKQANVWISIGLNRLSLCYTVQGKTKEAVEATREAQTIKILPEDPTVMAMSHFFYARALWHDGQREAALRHFNPPLACTPAIALCKEPSEENLEYLKELVEAGVDMSRIDEYGYSALDYTVFGQDLEMEALVIKGLRETEGKIEQIRTEASLRKGYRELFQDKMRPVLLGGGVHALQKLRLEYASTLAAMNEKSTRFDTLKYLRYPDFLRIGRLPRHSDGFTRNWQSELRQGSAAEFIIFVSYRWINTINQRSLPDDEENSQYKRMVVAVNEFLHINPQLDPDKLGIWLDYACIDQDDPIPGVTALPMLLAQCDVVISLVDEIYYNRAWCAIEAFLGQTLRESYSIHEWYELVPRSGPTGGWMLRPGAFDMGITPRTKALSYEEDRPKILFLERQTKLLR